MIMSVDNSMRVVLAQYGISCPRILVETGTYLGHGIERALGHFAEIHSIELSERFAIDAADKFSRQPHVTIHWGDSAEMLMALSTRLKEPVLFYLDAHFSGGPTAYGRTEDKGWPLLRELAVLTRRPENDVVIIDDIRLVGAATWSGIEDDPVYPRTHFDFTHITMDDISRVYTKPCRQIRHAPNPDGGCDWMVLSPIVDGDVSSSSKT
jgi:hypothetical protein